MVDENMVLHKKGDRLWHTDSSFMELRSAYSLLLAYEVPKEGGLTYFADMRSAYEDLPADIRARPAPPCPPPTYAVSPAVVGILPVVGT